MATNAFTHDTEALFRQQIDAARELNTILTQENEALIKREYEQVQSLTALKEQKSAEIEALAARLNAHLNTARPGAGGPSLAQALATLPSDIARRLERMKLELETQLQQCQTQNLINGQIIAVNRQSAETALAILRGQFSGSNLTYGAGGQPVNEKSSHKITKA